MGRKRGECTGYVLGRGGEWRRCPAPATDEWGGKPVCRRHFDAMSKRAVRRTARARDAATAFAALNAVLSVAAGPRP